MRLALLMCGCLIAVFVMACNRKSSIYEARVVIKPVAALPRPSPTPRVNPLYEDSPVGLVLAWHNFTKRGRYKMARSPQATGNVFHYGWSKELLVIVEDQWDKSASSLKLVYFHPQKDPYREFSRYWVKQNNNLAIANLSNASSDFVIYEENHPGCVLKYDARRKEYICWAAAQ